MKFHDGGEICALVHEREDTIMLQFHAPDQGSATVLLTKKQALQLLGELLEAIDAVAFAPAPGRPS